MSDEISTITKACKGKWFIEKSDSTVVRFKNNADYDLPSREALDKAAKPLTIKFENVGQAFCDAQWGRTCKNDFNYSVRPDIGGPSAPGWDLCRFTTKATTLSKGAKWNLNGATARSISIHVESAGGPIYNQYGSDVRVLIDQMWVVRNDATDAQRVENGCTHKADLCICTFENSATHQPGFNFCTGALECVQSCVKQGITFYGYEQGGGAENYCPVR